MSTVYLVGELRSMIGAVRGFYTLRPFGTLLTLSPVLKCFAEPSEIVDDEGFEPPTSSV
jgi:hypothetical protein